MRTVTVTASGRYDICIGRGLLSSVGEFAAREVNGRQAMIVSDSNVMPLYGGTVADSLAGAGFTVASRVLEAGEQSKSPENLIALAEACAQEGLTRTDILIALGGGVVGDITGLCAALYLRGIAFIQIPTSLLAMVDSSVGGKTAVDLKAGKNLLGAFNQPACVICDPDVLLTLPERDYAGGCAEIIKYALSEGGELASMTEKGIDKDTENIIEACVTAKKKYTEADEFDVGCRKILNLGHTVGHAVEKASGYSLTHGEAVAAGMCIITRACARLGICHYSTLDRLVTLCRSHGLPTNTSYSSEVLAAAARNDKKREGETLTLVLPEKFGSCVLKKIPVGRLIDYIMLGCDD